jgi:hypothetical protein
MVGLGGTMNKLLLVLLFITSNVASFFFGLHSLPENVVEKNCTEHGYKSKECFTSVQAAHDVDASLKLSSSGH